MRQEGQHTYSCNFCGDRFETKPEAVGHYRREHESTTNAILRHRSELETRQKERG